MPFSRRRWPWTLIVASVGTCFATLVFFLWYPSVACGMFLDLAVLGPVQGGAPRLPKPRPASGLRGTRAQRSQSSEGVPRGFQLVPVCNAEDFISILEQREAALADFDLARAAPLQMGRDPSSLAASLVKPRR